MSKTQDNLKKAFAGESQANRRYLAFAKKADEEGYPQIAKLFRAAADGETVHALSHFAKTGQIKSTKENLQAAIEGETEEFTVMYPDMIKDAELENETSAKVGFEMANTIEKEHAMFYQEAVDKMGDLEESDYYVCQVCGHLERKSAPDFCPVCKAPQSMFKKVD